MAQAVFDEHPLEQYLRETGETQEFMPGTSPILIQELEPVSLFAHSDDDSTGEDWEWRPDLLIQLVQFLESLLLKAQPANPLAERFKYNVISSSLLSSDLTHPSPSRSIPPHSIPGELKHNRFSSDSSISHNPSGPTSGSSNDIQYYFLSCLVLVIAFLLSVGLHTLAVLTIWSGLAGLYYLRLQGQSNAPDLTPCLDTLDELITTNNTWENLVQEVFTSIEKDELGAGLSSHSSPTSALRVALHSTLQTTQTQCDNVRHLLSALTSPSDISQLSEMYGPPSPIKPQIPSLESRSRPSSLPLQKNRRDRNSTTSPGSTGFTDYKRKTWNGPHRPSQGFGFSSPTMTPISRKRNRHRSDFGSLVGGNSSFSAPVTPSPSSPLTRVIETSEGTPLRKSISISREGDEDFKNENDEEETEMGMDADTFGSAALEFQKHRGFSTLYSPPPSASTSSSRFNNLPPNSLLALNLGSPTPIRGSISTPMSISPSSRLQNSRQPALSLSSLKHALQGALNAKRYTCAHFLALRFGKRNLGLCGGMTELSIGSGLGLGSGGLVLGYGQGQGQEVEEDNTYWEDVRSVMGLLISALSDAVQRLGEAVGEFEAKKLRDMIPTPCGSGVWNENEMLNHHGSHIVNVVAENGIGGSENGSGSGSSSGKKRDSGDRKRLSELVVSFAPVQSQMNKFANHVASIQGALEDAKGYLEECVDGLKKPSLDIENNDNQGYEGKEDENQNQQQHPALEAYERLRKELGFALRECERGRNHLLDLVHPPSLPEDDLDLEDDDEDVPGLGHDSVSEESDKAEISPNEGGGGGGEEGVVGVVGSEDGGGVGGLRNGILVDHDLLLMSNHEDRLPPPHGLEQVFEADTHISNLSDNENEVIGKTKLSREERIQQVKAKREFLLRSGKGLGLGMAMGVGMNMNSGAGTGLGLEPSPVMKGEEKWGPSGDVVQELKDVIWKVGERRRKGRSVSGDANANTTTASTTMTDTMRSVSAPLNLGHLQGLREEDDQQHVQVDSPRSQFQPQLPPKHLREPWNMSDESLDSPARIRSPSPPSKSRSSLSLVSTTVTEDREEEEEFPSPPPNIRALLENLKLEFPSIVGGGRNRDSVISDGEGDERCAFSSFE